MNKVKAVFKGIFSFIVIYLMVFLFSSAFVGAEAAIHGLKNIKDFFVYPANVSINGIDKLDREAILVITGLDKAKSYFDISAEDVDSSIRLNTWVKNCQVRMIFPDKVEIFIEEYKPEIIVTGEDSEGESFLMFADSEGVLFKKPFFNEIRDDLPFLYIDKTWALGLEGRKHIKDAIKIISIWKKNKNTCVLKSIRYDTVDGYSANCTFSKMGDAGVSLGFTHGDKDIAIKRDKFFNAVKGLAEKNIWAREFSFSSAEGGGEIVVSGAVHLKD